ncbi:rhodanese-like domain-containing protein [Nocardioides perillae]|uniref:Rhodanese-related sulfurtransferase n=1 Tax=Nocardioides perillae TaxID=1119534 RepID=A0A7Y9RQ61_9ACTN|nr:rhodanese-like domain-containing protein [Nocardioides perillae]NYG54280.1 rhodanese-related sulfurtransferase [Nocardioides perillae]
MTQQPGQAVPTVAITGVPDPLPEGLAVLDVREPVEWQHGHVEGALHVPLGELVQRLDEVPTDRQVLVVCRVGGRSAQATAWLQQQGVEAVNLDGGMLEWEAAGRPMVSERGAPPQVV